MMFRENKFLILYEIPNRVYPEYDVKRYNLP